jgi:tetratricopeptide (TPR) repeat protein
MNTTQLSRAAIELKSLRPSRDHRPVVLITLSLLAVALAGCKPAIRTEPAASFHVAPGPLALALATHEGTQRIDAEIRRRQDEVRTGITADAALERLGWLFVAKARESFDAGFYTLAEQCALALETRQPGSPEALLLRGHAWQSQHRFQEAEALAQDLVKRRGLAPDHGLLGDILVDLGRVNEAAGAYQTMLDLKPDPQGYARAAHIRWLKGDVEGAIELMRMAARGVSPRDAESAAWMHTQLARYLWQTQSNTEAARTLDAALQFQNGYAPALLLRGRMLLADGQTAKAATALREAARANPLPEYLWILAEALRANGNESEAHEAEAKLASTGALSDPRTYALYLAGRQDSTTTALALVKKELTARADIFTQDAMAWALAAAGRNAEAREHAARALAHGTPEARLYFHAAVIAAQAGHPDEARQFLSKLKPLAPQLLPSERQRLETDAALLSAQGMAPAVGEKLSRL